MRASNKTRILDAAVRVINREGVRAVTFESVSSEAGLTRGGLLYHFPSREALLRGIDAHLVQAWEASMQAIAGKPTAQTTAVERYEAYMRVSAQSATRAELLFMLESMDPETGSAPWNEAMLRWAPSPPGLAPSPPDPWRIANRSTRTGKRRSRISGSVRRELVMWVWTALVPALVAVAPAPPQIVS